jgi:hypothetical protein
MGPTTPSIQETMFSTWSEVRRAPMPRTGFFSLQASSSRLAGFRHKGSRFRTKSSARFITKMLCIGFPECGRELNVITLPVLKHRARFGEDEAKTRAYELFVYRFIEGRKTKFLGDSVNLFAQDFHRSTSQRFLTHYCEKSLNRLFFINGTHLFARQAK